METDRITIKIFCISLVIILLCEISGAVYIGISGQNPVLVLGVSRLIEIVLLVLLCYFETKGLECIGIGQDQLMPGIKKGVVWSLCFAGVVAIVFFLLWLLKVDALKLIHIRLPKDPLELFIFFMIGGLIGPIAEEVCFRGVLYGFFRKWGVLPALILSSLFFVLLHSGFGLIQIVGGLLFALSYEIEGKLMTPVVIHISGNLALFGLSLL